MALCELAWFGVLDRPLSHMTTRSDIKTTGAASPIDVDTLPVMLTVDEAVALLRIGRSLGYQLAREYEITGGKQGLPVVRLGGCLRVPRSALCALLQLTDIEPSSAPHGA